MNLALKNCIIAVLLVALDGCCHRELEKPTWGSNGWWSSSRLREPKHEERDMAMYQGNPAEEDAIEVGEGQDTMTSSLEFEP